MSTEFISKDNVKVIIKPGKKCQNDMSTLEKERLRYQPQYPHVLSNPTKIMVF